MKPFLLVVDDDLDLATSLEMLLQDHGFKVKITNNGKEALEFLKTAERLPDLILSDIMMPEMDGYEFFKTVSNSRNLTDVPFIFLSGLNTDKDIKLGKILGVDDYLTKPFKEDLLIATIIGKLRRRNRERVLNEKVSSNLIQKQNKKKSEESNQNLEIVTFLMIWDDRYGPKLIDSFPTKRIDSMSVQDLGNRFFQAIIPIYGKEQISKSEDLLLKIKPLDMNAYIFFDAYSDVSKRAKQTKFMIAVIAPIINYFDSLRLKQVFNGISEKVKEKKKLEITEEWPQIKEILTSKD